jgi:hypothetical protein
MKVYSTLCEINLETSRHSWASASRKLTPASAFWHPEFSSGTGLKICWTV